MVSTSPLVQHLNADFQRAERDIGTLFGVKELAAVRASTGDGEARPIVQVDKLAVVQDLAITLVDMNHDLAHLIGFNQPSGGMVTPSLLRNGGGINDLVHVIQDLVDNLGHLNARDVAQLPNVPPPGEHPDALAHVVADIPTFEQDFIGIFNPPTYFAN